MDRRELLTGMLAGLLVPRLLTASESESLDLVSEVSMSLDGDGPTWGAWALPADTPLECPNGVSMFSIVADEYHETRLAEVMVERPDGLTVMRFAFNQASGVYWTPDLGQQVLRPVYIKATCSCVVAVCSAYVRT